MRWALAVLFLAGCDQLQKKDDVQLAIKTGEQQAEIAQLRIELERLEDEQRSQANLLQATSSAQSATYDSLESLRATVNKNVGIDNKRNNDLTDHVEALERRVYGRR